MNALLNDDLCEMFQELNMPILDTEVVWVVKELKYGKSCGKNLVLNEVFIHGKDYLVQFITPLFYFIFDSGHFPNQWPNGLLVPLHKCGNCYSPNNFRGITLLVMLGKLFTRVINNRLDKWAESYGVYIEAQFGFGSGRGTVDCICFAHADREVITEWEKIVCLFNRLLESVWLCCPWKPLVQAPSVWA